MTPGVSGREERPLERLHGNWQAARFLGERRASAVLPCPAGDDGEVWASRCQRTRDGGHRLRAPSKAEARSSLHQPRPEHDTKGLSLCLISREAGGPTARGEKSGRAGETTCAPTEVVPRIQSVLGQQRSCRGAVFSLEKG